MKIIKKKKMTDKDTVKVLFDAVKGKKVRVLAQDRDNNGKRIDKKVWVHGTCEFLGFGASLGLQCTIDRLPIPIDSLTDVELVTDDTLDERTLP